MHATLPLLQESDFPALTRDGLTTLQVNLGYRCNQACLHCHVNAGPTRKEVMQRETVDEILRFLQTNQLETLDITGGAPELNPHFRYLVEQARALGLHVIDRCNLTILQEPEQEDLAAFLAHHEVEIIASLPCYQEENVNSQRGDGVYASSIAALHQLNSLGYGKADSGLFLNLVYNPTGPFLPPPQAQLEADYKRELAKQGIGFNHLFTITNLPIQRFGSTLISRGQFAGYMQLLKAAHQDTNLQQVMCRTLINIDWQGYVYDCDFNQMLNLPLTDAGHPRPHIRDMIANALQGRPIAIADHCYGCSAGQGSSCGGALEGEGSNKQASQD
ncbi:arsenosugar biosynthesis radical SAM (seleno)protein ArsS [Sulfuriflexus sp.]|uniref:arsenosugar biosynthesis radical SAM (seleno)protein ArsS n=1 Tax=Sulfuriflexus sp. TaxID=2015443 RepID=UPI0028CE6C42|nr:arsenosugar biosynthesis radical SAM (seleno)protein ArsS [Sulfuriflexus sp.]MDT8405103.1 arsenosugar biosynthesis radical SAM protein ArsS [Sulfuriflexus sp.]